MSNIIKLLFKLGISDKNSLKKYHKGVRDHNDINVLKCHKSGVIVLDKIVNNHGYFEKNIHYQKKKQTTVVNDKKIKSKPLEDDLRRFEQYKLKFKNKTVLDFGCGQGGFIQLIDELTKKTVGIELNDVNRKKLVKSKYDIRKNIGDLRDGEKFDFIILNMVFEHLDKPIELLEIFKQHLELRGELIIEVPHSRDFLLNTIDNESFKKFTFWSEHLILHTKNSLEIFLKHCGYIKTKIIGYQRYPLSNHIYWMSSGKPGGHKVLDFLNEENLVKSYNNFLIQREETDTIIGSFKQSLSS
ncbi:MAG: class I SAM-dependent methyltransferase [Flavobacteriaceae bacterium TMED238]|nr:MAG: class I SAM-dependent methyltransferase [Flavobacteriaceae bacterium TMED238]